jgi:predicted transcriptional regulator
MQNGADGEYDVTSNQRAASQVGNNNSVMNADTDLKLSVSDTVFDDGIVCLIDGKKKRNLRKWLILQYGMTPTEYRRMYNLSDDYPMMIASELPTPARNNVVTFEPPEVIASPRMR